jgi:hypothetical protein
LCTVVELLLGVVALPDAPMLEPLLMPLLLPDEPVEPTPEDPLVGCAIAAPPRANMPIAAAIACTFMIASPLSKHITP